MVAARLDKKDKKKLVIDEAEAEMVRLVFDLYLEREGNVGQSGVITITRELNRRGLRIQNKPSRTATANVLSRPTLARPLPCQ